MPIPFGTSAGVEVPDPARLFVALDLDGDARGALARWRDGIAGADPGIRPVAMEALHVTLCFLGSCALEEVDAIAAACVIESGAPITGLRLGAALWLPRGRPRLLAATIEDEQGALGRVQSALADALSAGGWYRPERRPFLAHATVARIVGKSRPRKLSPPLRPPSLDLAETATVTLYRSHLSPAGSRYEALRIISLTDEAAPAPPGAYDPVAIVRRFHAEQARAYAGHDLERLRPLLAADVVWHVPGRSRIAGEHRGVDAVLAYFDMRRRLTDETFRVTVHDIVASGEQVIQLAGGRAERDGISVSWETVGIFRLADGRIAECRLVPFDLYAFDEVWS
jgi:2'-5' RNA ligase